MKSSRMLTGALIAGAVAVASMFAAAPASAATLPLGQKITVVDKYDLQYYDVNPADAVASPVGTGTSTDNWITGVDVDDAGLGYATTTFYYNGGVDLEAAPEDELEDEPAPTSLVPFGYIPDGGYIGKADANTGTVTDEKLVQIDLPGEDDPYAIECSAIDYSKGVIIAVCYTGGRSEYGAMYIGTVNYASHPDVAVLTPAFTSPAEEGFLRFSAIAVNPVTGVIYGFTDDDIDARAFTITLDGAAPVEISDLTDHFVWGADFDRGGQLWLSVSDLPEPASRAANVAILSLATFDFTSGQPVVVDLFSSADPYEITQPEAITVWGALAATGSTVSSTAPAIAASGILLLGALLAAGAMAMRRRNADA